MLFDAFTTKTLLIFIILVLNLISLLTENLNLPIIILGFVFLILGFPVGNDSLNYVDLITTGEISRYGVIWDLIEYIYKISGFWVVLYIFSYLIYLYGAFKLSKYSSNPSLLFVTFITAPALGLDFLSIIRQCVATGFILIGYESYLRKKSTNTSLSYFAAYLSHPTSIIVPVFLTLKKYSNLSLKSFANILLITTAIPLLLFFMTSIKIVNDLLIVEFQSFFLEYIKDRDKWVVSGRFLSILWAVVLLFPVIFNSLIRYTINYKYLFSFGLFIITYITVWSFSPPLVRELWYFIPLIMHKIVSIVNYHKSDKIFTVLFIRLFIMSGSIYGIVIAPTFFWQGSY